MNKSKGRKVKLACGVGINNADYAVNTKINGKQELCPIYQKWVSMLKRCYSTKYQEKYPTYLGCSVVEDWLTFSNFGDWMVGQEYEGLQLDKDIRIKGNKIYSPDTCLFIPRTLNTLLVDNAASRGDWPVGIYWDKTSKKFMAQIWLDGKRKTLGRFPSAEEASQAYQQAREGKIRQLIEDNTYPMATQYLEQHI